MSNPFQLDGAVALVTGGGTGLGRAIALAMARAGATVIIVGRRSEPLEETAAADGIVPIVHDVTDFERAAALVSRITREWGSPSILVNNAGVHLKKPSDDTSVREFQTVLDTHVLAAHALTQAVIPGMREQKAGSIIFIASMTALFGIPLVTAYSAAKSAYLGMTRTLAVEHGTTGIRVNAIAPGWIESPMMRAAMDQDPERTARVLGRTPLGCFGNADDVAHAAVYLASPAARFVTGVCLPIDGSVSIGF